jgi:pimeloyl-ACP methyl ester carboxylesterase
MLDSEYLGGLSTDRQLILLDNHGTGGSETPADSLSYRCDRLVDDVEALRRHLDLDSMDLLAHSAGAHLGVLYAVRYPQPLPLARRPPPVHFVNRKLPALTPSIRWSGYGYDHSSKGSRIS